MEAKTFWDCSLFLNYFLQEKNISLKKMLKSWMFLVYNAFVACCSFMKPYYFRYWREQVKTRLITSPVCTYGKGSTHPAIQDIVCSHAVNNSLLRTTVSLNGWDTILVFCPRTCSVRVMSSDACIVRGFALAMQPSLAQHPQTLFVWKLHSRCVQCKE